MAGAGGYYERRGYFTWPKDRPLEIRCAVCGRLLIVREQTTGDGQVVVAIDPCQKCNGNDRSL